MEDINLIEKCKREAAKLAVKENIKNNMKIGIGSGSTIVFVIRELAKIVKENNWDIICIPTSYQAEQLIIENGLALGTLNQNPELDIDLDGADESKLYVTCKLREGMLHSCGLEVLKGSPIYAEPQSTNVLDVTQLFLERYRVYSGAEYIIGMCNMLDRVDATEIETIKESNVYSSVLPPHSKVVIEDGVRRDIKTITVTEANVKLTITNIVDSYSVERISFEWTYTVNGLDVPQNVVRVTFEGGV